MKKDVFNQKNILLGVIVLVVLLVLAIWAYQYFFQLPQNCYELQIIQYSDITV